MPEEIMPKLSSLRVPRRHVSILHQLAEFSEEQIAELIKRLSEMNARASRYDFARQFEAVLALDTRQDAEAFADVLISLHSVHASHGWSFEDIAESIARADILEIEEESSSRLRERLIQLLSVERVARLSKALFLSQEQDHLFHVARVITDIRPVFKDDPSSFAQAAVVLQTLRIDYYDTTDGSYKTFTVSLTVRDAERLREVIERGLTKGAASGRLLEEKDIIPIPTEVEEW